MDEWGGLVIRMNSVTVVHVVHVLNNAISSFECLSECVD